MCIRFRSKSARSCRCKCVPILFTCVPYMHASFVFCDTFTCVFHTRTHESSQNFNFNIFFVWYMYLCFTHMLEPSRKCICINTSLAGQAERHYLVLRFEMHARKYTNKMLDLVSHHILMMGRPAYKLKEISHINLVF
jgi:hypothetical protein